MAGQFFELNSIVRNRGDGPSEYTTLSYYRSTDSTITSTDTEVGTDWVSGLNASESSAESTLTYAPSSTGTYYYGVCVGEVSGESDTTDNCSDADAVTVSQFDIDKLPWVVDGISGDERRAMDQIGSLARIDPSMSHRVAGSLWLSDGVSDADLQAMADLLALARSHPQAAALLTTIPDQTGGLIQDVQDVANSLQQISFAGDTAQLDQVLSQSWFQDGLTQEEAALIVVLRSAYETGEVFQDLVTNGHVWSETISVPLAGEVDLFVVGRSESWLDGELERMAFAVKSMESFMETPWPRLDTIVLLEFESKLGSDSSWNAGTHAVVKKTSKYLTYHELAHHYFGGQFPRWLSEGAAEFLSLYTLRLTGDIGSVNFMYYRDHVSIYERCAPRAPANVQGWIGIQSGLSPCPYWLGRQFLRGMYRVLGHEVVSSALAELYEGEGTTEDEIYQAFQTNTPSSRRNEFHDLYHCLHGRPIPGYTAAPKAAPSPEIRDALVALYNATNGPGWKNSENWLSEAPIDEWYGVLTDCDGYLTHLILDWNQLTGPIPPELGNLSELGFLSLESNQLTGPIPPELGNLSELGFLSLESNQLTGPIPSELGNLSDLTYLSLGDNQLSGTMPPELGNLSELWHLMLWNNHLTGLIPPELANLAKLQQLWLDSNQLTGEIPPELGSLFKLEWLYVSGNQLTGCVPRALTAVENNDLDELGLEVCEDS